MLVSFLECDSHLLMGKWPQLRLKAVVAVMSIPSLRLLQSGPAKIVLSEALDEFEDRRPIAQLELPDHVEQLRLEQGDLRRDSGSV